MEERRDEQQGIQISGIYRSTEITKNAHTEGRTTMGTRTIRERLYEDTREGRIPMSDMKAIETYLNKKEYREEYNSRPEVKDKRRAYNRARNEKAKLGRQLLQGLLGKNEE